MTSSPCTYCQNRVFEWMATGALLGIGILQLVWPTAFQQSKLQFLLDIVSPINLAIFCLTVGGFRAVALYLNHGWPLWGARIRMFTAIGGAAVWMQMGLSLIFIQIAINGPPSPSVPLYLSLVCAELFSTYRAAGDAQYR